MVLCQSVNFAHTRSVTFFLAFQAKCVHACLTRGFVVICSLAHTRRYALTLAHTRHHSLTFAHTRRVVPFRAFQARGELHACVLYAIASSRTHTPSCYLSRTHAIIRSLSRTHAVLYHFMPFRPKVNFTHAYCMRALVTHTCTKLLL